MYKTIIKYKYSTLLSIIVCIALFFRLFLLGSVPPSPSVDEVATGYNAYSILMTGRGEHGNFLPLVLRSYDDYRPALYTYLVIPFLPLFGLTAIAIRLPAVILSVLSVWAVYFLAKELCKNYQYNRQVGLVSSLLLAVNPWHIYLSRIGFEANAALAFFVFAVVFFLQRRMFLMLLFFGLSFVSYQSEKIFIPLFAITLVALFYKFFLFSWKRFLVGVIVLFILLAPFLKETFSQDALIRFNGTSIFNAVNDPQHELEYRQALTTARAHNDIVQVILLNRRFYYFQYIIPSYFSHFDAHWLFENLTNQAQFKAPFVGLFYKFELPLILFGLFALFIIPFPKKIRFLILMWILLAPIPAAITTGAPHAVRTYPLVIILEILSGLGFVTIFTFSKNIWYRLFTLITFLVFVVIAASIFYQQYFYAFPKANSESFQYAAQGAMKYVVAHKGFYDKVIISNEYNLYQSYMFYLFYSKYDPRAYLKEGGTGSGGYAATHMIGNITFRPINYALDKNLKHTLIVGNRRDFPRGSLSKSKVIFLNVNKMKGIAVFEN